MAYYALSSASGVRIGEERRSSLSCMDTSGVYAVYRGGVFDQTDMLAATVKLLKNSTFHRNMTPYTFCETKAAASFALV